jgi:predicted  nucleic acid-binding Zn-ribbon protein
MTAHSPVAQVEVESQMRKIEAEVDDLKETIKGHENEYKEATREERKDILGQMIIAARTNLQALNEELKALRHQQQGNEQRTRPFILWCCAIL